MAKPIVLIKAPGATPEQIDEISSKAKATLSSEYLVLAVNNDAMTLEIYTDGTQSQP